MLKQKIISCTETLHDKYGRSYKLITDISKLIEAFDNQFGPNGNNTLIKDCKGNPLIKEKHLLAAEILGYDLISDKGIIKLRSNKNWIKPTWNFNLISIAHGSTPNNDRHCLHGGVTDHPVYSTLNTKGWEEVREGGTIFWNKYLPIINQQKNNFIFLRTNSTRTLQTWQGYQDYLPPEAPSFLKTEPLVTSKISEIFFGPIDGLTEEEILKEFDEEKVKIFKAYKQGHVTTSFPKGSRLMYELRVFQWLQYLDVAYPGKTIVLFGHGTLTNALECINRRELIPIDSNGLLLWREYPLKRGMPLPIINKKIGN